jgi:hypothetical protein
MLVRLDNLVMLEKYVKSVVILFQEGQSLSVFLLQMFFQFVSHQILRVVRTIFKLINSRVSNLQLQLFRIQYFFVVINVRVIVLKVNSVHIYRGNSVIVRLIV